MSDFKTWVAGLTSKTSPVDADSLPLVDSVSGATQRLTWANLKATAKTYFDTLYALSGAVTSSGLTQSTNKLLGRGTAATGAIEEITLGTGLSLSGTTLNAAGAGATLAANVFTGAQEVDLAVAAASTDGKVLATTATATVGAQKWSPRFRWTGSGWKTTATAAAQTVDWIAELQPVQGAANPSSNLVFSSQVNGGGYASQMVAYSLAASFSGSSAGDGPALAVGASNGNSQGVVIGSLTSAQSGIWSTSDTGSSIGGYRLKFGGTYTVLNSPGASDTLYFSFNDSITASLTSTTFKIPSLFQIGGTDTGIGRNAARKVEINNGTAGTFGDLIVRQHFVDQTITTGGTTGAQTINKAAGTVNFAAGASSLVVTNSLCTTSSTVYCSVRTADATASIKSVVPAAGSFTITLGAAATAETSVGFLVIN